MFIAGEFECRNPWYSRSSETTRSKSVFVCTNNNGLLLNVVPKVKVALRTSIPMHPMPALQAHPMTKCECWDMAISVETPPF